MKRCLFLILLSVASAHAAKTYTGKTFLQPQPFRFPTEYTFHDHLYTLMNKKDLVGGQFQITSFYRRDNNPEDIGAYFSRLGCNCISIGPKKTDFQATNLVFTDLPSTLDLRGVLELSPIRKIRGIELGYIHKLSDHLYLCLSVPWIHITRRMQPCVYNQQKQEIEDKVYEIRDYFMGRIEQDGQPHFQAALCCAKIKCHGSDYRTGFGDVVCSLSYQSQPMKGYWMRYFGGVILPTSNRPKGEWLYEPMLGNGQQWGIMVGAEGTVLAYETRKIKIKATVGGTIKQFFSNTQKRMVSFRSDDLDSSRSWAHYYGLLGEEGKYGVFPAANLLMRDVKVTPGVYFDGFINYSLFHRNRVFSVGYNLFAKESESVKVRSWTNNKYALASPLYDTATPFTIVANPSSTDDNLEGPIQRNMLDASVAETPATMTHKVYAMASFVVDSLRIPVTVGIGGAYEFAQNNAAPEGYELFMKVGASF